MADKSKGPDATLIGAMVWYYPHHPVAGENISVIQPNADGQPLLAIIVHANEDATVNLVIWTATGAQYGLQNIGLWDENSTAYWDVAVSPAGDDKRKKKIEAAQKADDTRAAEENAMRQAEVVRQAEVGKLGK